MNSQYYQLNVGQLVRYYLHHWFSILSGIILCSVSALVISFFLITPQYQANITVYVNSTKSSQSIESISGANLTAAQQLVNTYVNIIKSKTVLGEVIEKAGLNCTVADIRDIMTAKQIDDTEMFSVTITHPNAEMAAHIANTIAEVAPSRISGFVRGSSTEIIDYADIPTSPYKPNYRENGILGGLLGGVFVGLVLTFRFIFDMRIKNEEDMENYLHIPVLGAIPEYESDGKKKNGKYERMTMGQRGRHI